MPERGGAIVLIGFMGSGKSAAGRRLEMRTGWPRYDTDAMISERFGSSINEIFAQHGESEFRRREAEVLLELPRERAIVVTGGGIVLRPGNVECIRELGTVVNLTADEQTLFDRVSRRTSRPLLQGPDPAGRLRELVRERGSLYRSVADFTLDTSHLTRDEVVKAILARVELPRHDVH
ncbi:MAG: shikimate kinase [Chthoniobacterales bacterium]|nr:shikimate kinase [Chthoniobacterales bacterium]